MKKAIITGITGQDGSYLAEFLLSKGYKVFGMVRRASSERFERIEHLKGKVELHQADLLDQHSITNLVQRVQPDELYNLAAQSFVPTSWDQPLLTAEYTGLGVTRILEAIRLLKPDTKFYQASSSEMFGQTKISPQNEDTPFYPRSPYGASKVYGHWITVNYRESYDISACSGILFNHESVPRETPVIIRRNGLIDCLPICELVPDPEKEPSLSVDFEVWDRDGFVRARHATAKWNGPANDRRVHRVMARCGEVRATGEHVVITAEGPAPTESLKPGQAMSTVPLPEPPGITSLSKDWAWLLGILVADGWFEITGSGQYQAAFRNNDPALLERVASLWKRLTAEEARDNPGRSGRTGEPTGGLRFNGPKGLIEWIARTMYTEDRSKRVPLLVLNADAETWRSFLSGYNAGDGLKKGHGDREFKNFKTSSPVLAAGLWWMASSVFNQRLTLNVDFVTRDDGEHGYYSINLNSNREGKKGAHLIRPHDEIKSIRRDDYEGWLYDLETDSGTFHAGVGELLIHNSPRRGKEFVTRKITWGAARAKLDPTRKLKLGNMDARRDWGYAGDYVRAMWLMLQQDEPDDYVIATGEMHTVREFAEAAFAHVGLNWKDHVVVDKGLFRPAEVEHLKGDASKAKEKLGWTPEVSFQELVRMMVDADLERAKAQRA